MYVCMYVCILRHPYVALKVEIILGFLSNHKRTSLSSFHRQSQGLEQMLRVLTLKFKHHKFLAIQPPKNKQINE